MLFDHHHIPILFSYANSAGPNFVLRSPTHSVPIRAFVLCVLICVHVLACACVPACACVCVRARVRVRVPAGLVRLCARVLVRAFVFAFVDALACARVIYMGAS